MAQFSKSAILRIFTGNSKVRLRFGTDSESVMRISTLLVAAIAAVAAFSGAVIHQHGGDVSQHMAMVAKHLNLTPSQEKQFKAEHAVALKKMAAIDANTKLDAKGKQKAKEQLHNELMAKAKTILTPEQLKQFVAMHAMADKQQMMMHIFGKLGLSDDQKASVHKLMSETMTAMQAIMHDGKLSDAQKQARAEELHNQAMGKIQGILTPEQFDKAKALHGEAGKAKGIPPV